MKLLFKTTMVEWKINLRNFVNVFFSLIFPVMMMLLFGSIYGNDPSQYYGGHGSVDTSTAGYICMVISVSGLMTLPITLSQYRERKILKRFMATPIRPFDILVSQLIVNAIVSLMGTVLLIAIGILVFDLKFFGNVLEVIAAMLLITLSIFSLGLFIAGVTKNAKSALAISYVVYFPMLFLSGATLPLQFMPEAIVTASKFLPLTYGVELLQGLWLGGSMGDYLLPIGVLSGLFVLFGGISLMVFKWE
ncbi:MAG: ABC transporter permease [Eubacteriales bacterium]